MSFNPDAGTISGASDAALDNPSDDQVFSYDADSDKWVNQTASVGMVDGLQTVLDGKQPVDSIGGLTKVCVIEEDAEVPVGLPVNTLVVEKAVELAADYLGWKNNVIELTDSSNDRFARVNITDDSTGTSEWPDRLAFYFDGTRTGYFNEYGELRARPAKHNTVALRVMSRADAADDAEFFQASRTGLNDAVLGVSKKYITTKEAVKRNYYTEAPSDGHIERTDLNYTLEAGSPEVSQVWVNGKKTSWLNEWGALRGRNPYTNWTDSLARAIIDTGDNMSSIGNAFEIVDRRPAQNVTVYGRNWGTGQLTRNGNPMADVFVMENGGTPPSTLPVGTVIIELEA